MIYRRILICLIVLPLPLSAAFASQKDVEATALIKHARQLSDIRAEGAPAFRMKASFKLIAKDGSAKEGEYEEVWVSKAQWRKDTVVGSFRRVEVANGRKRWLLDGATPTPEHLEDVGGLSGLGGLPPDDWKPQKSLDRTRKGLSVRCVETGPSSLCFDKANGTFAYRVMSTPAGSYSRESSCSYSDYQRFGERLVARSYACAEDKKTRMEARVVELVANPAPDQSLFTPPEGGKESVNCLGRIQPPVVVQSPSPTFPGMSPGTTSVLISMLVGTDGTPQDFKVLSRVNPEFDRVALESVKQWRFKPATCNGEAMAMTINLDVDFRF